MTPLRQRMIDAMQVRGFAQRTQECYTQAIARMARHHHRSPELLRGRLRKRKIKHAKRTAVVGGKPEP